MKKVCARAGCGNPLPRMPFLAPNRPEEYCCYECAGVKGRDHRKDEMKIPHPDFGGAGVTYEICDRASCRKPITLAWPGRDGRYCSNDCYKAVEIEGEEMTTTESGNTATTNTAAPITAGKPAKKGAAKKGAAKKAAPAKKGAAKKAAPAKKAPSKTNGNGIVRAGSNMENLLKLTQTAKGATLADLVEKTGWEAEMVTRTISNLRNKGIEVTRDEDGRYHGATA